MPIGWGVVHASRLVTATGTGVVTRADIDGCLHDLTAAATLSYGKIFHMKECRLELNKEDLVAIGNRIRSHEVQGSMGKVAVLAGSDDLFAQAAEFNAKVLAERPLRIFRDIGAALVWLNARDPECRQLAIPSRSNNWLC
jgi:hypothetical protein